MFDNASYPLECEEMAMYRGLCSLFLESSSPEVRVGADTSCEIRTSSSCSCNSTTLSANWFLFTLPKPVSLTHDFLPWTFFWALPFVSPNFSLRPLTFQGQWTVYLSHARNPNAWRPFFFPLLTIPGCLSSLPLASVVPPRPIFSTCAHCGV